MSAQAMEVRQPHVGFLHNSEVREALLELQQDQADLLEGARQAHKRASGNEKKLPVFDEQAERRRVLSDSQRIMQAKVLFASFSRFV